MARVQGTYVLNNSDVREILHNLWDFYKNGGGPVTIVNDGGTDAVSLSGGAPAGATPTDYTDWSVNGYIVIEGPHANGGVWQAQIQYQTGDDLDVRFSFRGGWENSDEFTGVTTTLSGYTRVNDSFTPSVGTTMKVVADDTYEYESGKALCVTFMGLIQPGNTLSEGYMLGGLYHPSGAGQGTSDTHPCGALRGDPSTATSSNDWGNNAGGDAQGAGAVEGAHTTGVPLGLGLRMALPSSGGANTSDMDGVESQPILWAHSTNHTYGFVPPQFATGINNTIPNGDTYAAGGYQKFNQIAFKFD